MVQSKECKSKLSALKEDGGSGLGPSGVTKNATNQQGRLLTQLDGYGKPTQKAEGLAPENARLPRRAGLPSGSPRGSLARGLSPTSEGGAWFK